jgi:hypothetical protein
MTRRVLVTLALWLFGVGTWGALGYLFVVLAEGR